MPGCRQYTLLPGIVSTGLALPGGATSFGIPIPTDPTAIGALLFFQVYVYDPGANALGFVNTPVGYMQVGSM